jgi:aspartate aminotransferase
MKQVGASTTLEINAAAKRMKRDGIDVIDLSAGEPDFPTAPNVGEAAKRAIDKEITHYTMNTGVLELREVICQKFERDNGVTYEPDQIIVSAGAKQCIFNACAALINPGDRVLIPAPYWVSYPEIVRLMGAEPVPVMAREETGFRLTAEDLSPHLAGAKALFLNSPCNPTGAVYSRDELLALARPAVDAGLVIISDEIYEKLVYDGEFASAASFAPEIRDRAVVINGVSKAYAMTGWRIGYAAGPREVIKAMAAIQSHSTSNACSVSQMAALEALSGPQDDLQRMVVEFAARRDIVLDRIGQVKGWTCVPPGGAFYAFPNVQASLGRRWSGGEIESDNDLAKYLLQQAHVALVPGEGFGAPGFIRISYSQAPDRLETAMTRIAEAIAALK